eukprot:NODE_706_length_1406_cov_95.630803_g521_i0.p1 GENE.NODE_706_length_1406_cov_95.630803_g521_i0~~NODE_706_length_1406_cov_95.630803_g521_i0.p1  ORF type:complete len:448 (+),score=118.81 NODE_706_length_1406_cov_95.630803_g521_i0:61-1344(+)
MNHNVLINYIFTWFVGLQGGICYFSVLPAFIFLITHSNTMVGLAEALQGLTEALIAIPLGFLVDRPNVRRQTILRLGAVVGLCSAVLSVYAIWQEHYLLICGAFVLVGGWNASALGPVDTILADSVPTAARSRIYATNTALQSVSAALGPAVAMVIFHFVGNTWTIPECRSTLCVGFGAMTIGVLFQFAFLDSKTLSGESEALVPEEVISQVPEAGTCACVTPAWVPLVLSLSDIVVGFGAGMTIKFFPLFFQIEVNLSPMTTNAIYVACPICIAALAFLAQRLSQFLGRIPVTILFTLLGVLCLFLMAYLKSFWSSAHIIVPLYLFRTASINAPSALLRSVMMDFVPKANRGKWNAVASVASFGWCGSAAVGGVLVDAHGYGITFLITACVQCAGALLLLPLIGIVPLEKQPLKTTDQAEESMALN